MKRDLRKMFFPETIAMIGASSDVSKHNGALLQRAINAGFPKENIYPVNPKYERLESFNMPCYHSVADLPIIPDVIFIAVPAKFALQALQDCGAKGIKNVVMITAGFKEVSEKGAKAEEVMLKIAYWYQINLMGPNCPGFISSKLHFGMVDEERLKMGKIVFVSQSGGMNASLASAIKRCGGGVRLIAGIGNKAQLDEVDILQSFYDYPEMLGGAEVISLYLEGLDRPQKFLEIAQKLRRRGIVILTFKAGRSEVAQKAAYSHTGAMATPETALNALLKKAGVVRADNINDFIKTILLLEHSSLFDVGKVAVLTNSGGVGVITVDAIEKAGLDLACLGADTQDELRNICEKHKIWYLSGHPIDLIGGGTPDLFYEAVSALLKRPEIGSLIVSFVKPPLAGYEEATAQALARAHQEMLLKPMAAICLAEVPVKIKQIYQKAGLPFFTSPDAAMRVLDLVGQLKQSLKRGIAVNRKFAVMKDVCCGLLEILKRDGLSGLGMQGILRSYGLVFPDARLFKEECELQVDRFAADGIRKLVMKIDSPYISHKSDVGGVLTNIDVNDRGHVVRSFQQLFSKLREQNFNGGVLVQEMIEGGYEVLIGVKKVSEFGHLITFGEGGIYTEVRGDVAFGLAPLTITEARKMVKSVKFYTILQGVRGQKPANIEAIVEALLRVSQLVTDFPEIEELDINPAKVDGERLICLDMRMKLEGGDK